MFMRMACCQALKTEIHQDIEHTDPPSAVGCVIRQSRAEGHAIPLGFGRNCYAPGARVLAKKAKEATTKKAKEAATKKAKEAATKKAKEAKKMEIKNAAAKKAKSKDQPKFGAILSTARHAEENAIRYAQFSKGTTDNATVYVTHLPCFSCAKMLASYNVKRVLYLFWIAGENYKDSVTLLGENNITCSPMPLKDFEEVMKCFNSFKVPGKEGAEYDYKINARGQIPDDIKKIYLNTEDNDSSFADTIKADYPKATIKTWAETVHGKAEEEENAEAEDSETTDDDDKYDLHIHDHHHHHHHYDAYVRVDPSENDTSSMAVVAAVSAVLLTLAMALSVFHHKIRKIG